MCGLFDDLVRAGEHQFRDSAAGIERDRRLYHSRAGFRGLAVSFVSYLKDVPYFCDEVLPRLARL